MIVTAHRRRTSAHSISIYDASDNLISIDASDKIRVKIGFSGRTPRFDIVSGTPTANGSSVTAANPATLRLNQNDLNVEAGVYPIEVSVVDADDSGVIKHAQTGVLVVHDTAKGNVT